MKHPLLSRWTRLTASVFLLALLWLPSAFVEATPVSVESPPSVGAVGITRPSSNVPSLIFPNVYSGNVTSLQITVQPEHGVVVVSGLQMIYTPARGYLGSDIFHYTATGVGGTSQPSSIWLSMIPPTVTAASYPRGAVYGEIYAGDLQVTGGSAPYQYSVSPGDLPPGMSIDAAGHISGTPTAVGRYALGVRVVDAHGFEGSVQHLLYVYPGNPNISWDLGSSLQRVVGEEDFELPLPQSNSPGEFTFFSTNPAVATVNGRTVTLVGEGHAMIAAIQDAAGNYSSASRIIPLTVSLRPDPTADTSVMTSAQAQSDASMRFAQVQSSNIRGRLRQLRSGSNPVSFNVALAHAGSEGMPGLAMPLDQVGDGMAQSLPRMPPGWGIWAAGTATFGQSGRRRGGSDFSTGGLSIGADRAVGERVLLGMVGSFGRQDTELADASSHSDADQRSLAVYGLWRAGEHVFVDALLAGGELDFDMARWSAPADGVMRASRQGSQWFGSLTFGYEKQFSDALTLTGYGRYDGQRAQLDAYHEQGRALYALSYGRQNVRNNALALGIEGSHLIQGRQARWRPFWGLEYRRTDVHQVDVAVNYIQRPSVDDYLLSMPGYSENVLSLQGGLDLQLRKSWLLTLLLGHEQGSNQLRSNSIGLQVSYGNPSIR